MILNYPSLQGMIFIQQILNKAESPLDTMFYNSFKNLRDNSQIKKWFFPASIYIHIDLVNILLTTLGIAVSIILLSQVLIPNVALNR